MIGNDVIDLRLTAVQSDWQRPRFRKKVFTKGENRAINISEDPFKTVWRLWSMKESAYKVYLRLHPKRFFNPKRLECSISEHGTGQVQVEGYSFQTETSYQGERMYTTALLGEKQQVIEACFTIPSSENDSNLSST